MASLIFKSDWSEYFVQRTLKLSALNPCVALVTRDIDDIAISYSLNFGSPFVLTSKQNKKNLSVEIPTEDLLHLLKGQCHEIFRHFFISWLEAIWAPDKQAKMFLLKNSFSQRYSRKIRLRAMLAFCLAKTNPRQNRPLPMWFLLQWGQRGQKDFTRFFVLHPSKSRSLSWNSRTALSQLISSIINYKNIKFAVPLTE